MENENHFETNIEPNVEAPKKRKRGGWKVLVVILLAVLFGLISALTFVGVKFAIEKITKTEVPKIEESEKSQIGKTEIKTESGVSVVSDVADVADAVMPSIVSITSMSVQEVQTFPFGGVTKYEVPSSGSGIIIAQNNKEVLIVTNNHVVEDSKTLTVVWIDGESSEAQIKGTDADKDLAVIAVPVSKLKDTTKKEIKIATLGDSTKLRVGESAIAIGNALGYGQSVTLGIISALERTVDNIDGTLIQTDAAINPGNSGGALLNAKGEVIGINAAKVSSSSVEGMGYAIPITDARDVIEGLINQEERKAVPESQRGALGIYGMNITSDVMSWYNVPQGVCIQGLVRDGAAEKAQIPVGSIITKIAGKDIDNLEELNEELQYHKKGETIKVTCYVMNGMQYVEQQYEVTLK